MNDLSLAYAPALLPTLVTAAGEHASYRFLEFFAGTIRNQHTRRAYGRAAVAFLAWSSSRGGDQRWECLNYQDKEVHMQKHMQGGSMPQPPYQNPAPPREAKLFRNNRSQAVRIPADFEFPGDRVMIHRDGVRLIIEPVRKKNLLDVLAGLEPLGPDDQFPEIDDTLLPVKDVDL